MIAGMLLAGQILFVPVVKGIENGTAVPMPGCVAFVAGQEDDTIRFERQVVIFVCNDNWETHEPVIKMIGVEQDETD